MVFLIIALVLGATLVWLGRRRGRARGDVRVAGLVFASLAAAGAAVTALELRWYVAAPLAVLAAWLWSRLIVQRPAAASTPRSTRAAMSADRARALLGVGAGASAEEIQAAYLRLIRAVHPDRGGTSGLAAELNAARDRLIGRR